MHAHQLTLEKLYSAFARLDSATMAQRCAADAASGQAHWEADYRFSMGSGSEGRRVHNIIDSRFTFNPPGLIRTPRDSFDFWA